ncbi:MAG: dUTP diphosphatase [Candidatus Pacearchaeota archaeon]|jgi:dUTP pyrophosphatase
MVHKARAIFKKLVPEAIIPSYAHPGDAGMDIFSNENIIINAGERYLISTGWSLELPEGYVAFIKDKSGIAYKKGMIHMAGVIEYTYRGEYKVLLYNTSKEPYEVKKGDKIAQLVILPVATAEIEVAEELSETSRGAGGFGSTGISYTGN